MVSLDKKYVVHLCDPICNAQVICNMYIAQKEYNGHYGVTMTGHPADPKFC